MSLDGWRTAHVVHGRTLDGAASQLVVGLVDTEHGRRIAARCGETGDTILLDTSAAVRLIEGARAAISEQSRR